MKYIRNKLTSPLFLLWYKVFSEKIEFPLKNVKNIALRPSQARGEMFYSLPLVEKLSEKFEVSVLLPDGKTSDYFQEKSKRIIYYPENLGPINAFRLKNNLKKLSFDLLIDFNRTEVHVFSYILRNPVTASIFDVPGVNITAKAEKKSITSNYQYLIELLGLSSITWELESLKPHTSKKEKNKNKNIGITSDISAYHNLKQVKKIEDLYGISKLITPKNDLSAIAFLLKIPQVLLLEKEDSFQPPESIKVVRYSKRITPEIIGDCLVL